MFQRGLKVTGMGALSAVGHDVRQLKKSLFTGEGPHSYVDSSLLNKFFRLTLAEEHLMRHDVSPTLFKPNLLALLATIEAMDSAGFTRKDLSSLRVGICIGSSVGCTNFQDDYASAYFSGKNPSPEPFFEYFNNNTAQFLARHLNVSGPVLMVSNACNSGSDALGIASGWLRENLCDVVICGGTEFILERVHAGFRSLLLTSSECHPFDQKRTGLKLADGAGILILEKEDVSDHTAIARVLDYACANDAYHTTAPHPEGQGLRLAFQDLLCRTGLTAKHFDFICAHGTGTEQNDLVEGHFIRDTFPDTPFFGTKGSTGHTLGASGALQAVITAFCLSDGSIPATKGFTAMDNAIGVSPTTQNVEDDFSIALSMSLGFGGSNTLIALERA